MAMLAYRRSVEDVFSRGVPTPFCPPSYFSFHRGTVFFQLTVDSNNSRVWQGHSVYGRLSAGTCRYGRTLRPLMSPMIACTSSTRWLSLPGSPPRFRANCSNPAHTMGLRPKHDSRFRKSCGPTTLICTSKIQLSPHMVVGQ